MFHQNEPLKITSGNRNNPSFVQSMRTNIKELNRSMNSIEKMISQSRKIIMQSKENSLSRTASIQKNQGSPFKMLGSPSVRHQQLSTKKHLMPGNPNIRFSYQPNTSLTHSQSHQKISKMTFGENSKLKALDSFQTSMEHQHNLAKFQPNVVKKEIEFRKSGVKEDKEVEFNHETPKQKEGKTKQHSTPLTEPYHRFIIQNNEIYKFSPQQTSSKQKKNPRISSFGRQAAPKIKLKATPRTNNVQSSHRKSAKASARTKTFTANNPNIKIEDDEDQETTPQQNSLFQQSSFDPQSTKYRFKTDYNHDDSSLWEGKNVHYESPIPKSIKKKTIETKKKPNFKQYNHQQSKKDPSIPSYRDPKIIKEELSRCTPRETRQTLVKELEQLQTESFSEEQRKAKFILKIKKYGFVEKYLTESEIWAVYDHLIWTNVPELKWPIYIVDQVYKKMKNIQ